MPASIEGRSRELLEDKNFCHVVTLGRDGTPHVVMVWVSLDGDEVLINGAEGRDWPANLRRDPRVWLTVVNRENQYQYVRIDGEAIEVTPEGADEHIDLLAKKYLDADSYPFRAPGEIRLKVRVRPDRVRIWGG